MLCIKNGTIHDAVHEQAFQGDILVENGKIKAIGENLKTGEDDQIVDVKGLSVYPGFVEAHGHIGLDGYGIGYEGMDYNEMNDIVSPQLRGIDGVKPLDAAFPRAAAAGVTCVCVGPGSANVLGGTFTTIKTVGKRVDDMVVRDGVAMKCAFGENPKRVYRDKKDSCRMSTAALLREMLFKTREYLEKKEAAGEDVSKRPAFDMKLEALIPRVERGDAPEGTRTRHRGYFRGAAHCPGVWREDHVRACDGGASDRGGAGRRGCAAGGGAFPDQRVQIRAAQQELDYAGASGRRRLPGLHHHGLAGDSSGISSPLRGAGGAGRDGSLRGIAGHHHQSGQTCGDCGQGRISGGRKGCGSGGHGRLSLRARGQREACVY